MDIMELGAVGELVSGVAVLVTLIYLSIQVRQGNQLERAESQRAWVRDWSPAVFAPMMDPVMANIIRRGGTRFDSLNGDEKMMVTGWWGAVCLLTEVASQLGERGLVDQDFANTTVRRAVSILQQPGANRWWTFAKGAYTEKFQAQIDGSLGDSSRPPSFDALMPWFASDDAPSGA